MSKRNALSFLPNLVTIGNAVCGFGALVKVTQEDYLGAAWLVLLAMVFDAFDGLVARATKSSSPLGGELDSLSDMVSFGVAPAVLVAVMVATVTENPLYRKVAWVFCVLYAVGTAFRLARFNLAEDDGESGHSSFQGLPSPAAAGTVASLVILADWLVTPDTALARRVSPERIEDAHNKLLLLMPVLALALGYLMTSQIRYVHLVTKWFRRRHPLTYLIDLGVFLVLAAMFLKVALAVAFCFYTLTGPLLRLGSFLVTGRHEKEEDFPIVR